MTTLTVTRPAATVPSPGTVAPDAHSASALVAAFLASGYLPGVPPGLPADCRDIDARIARRMKCPRCKRRGCQYRPFHKAGGYRVLAACKDRECGGAEEL